MREQPYNIYGLVINGFVIDKLQQSERPTMSQLSLI